MMLEHTLPSSLALRLAFRVSAPRTAAKPMNSCALPRESGAPTSVTTSVRFAEPRIRRIEHARTGHTMPSARFPRMHSHAAGSLDFVGSRFRHVTAPKAHPGCHHPVWMSHCEGPSINRHLAPYRLDAASPLREQALQGDPPGLVSEHANVDEPHSHDQSFHAARRYEPSPPGPSPTPSVTTLGLCLREMGIRRRTSMNDASLVTATARTRARRRGRVARVSSRSQATAETGAPGL